MEMINRAFGGSWKLRAQAQKSRNRYMKAVYSFIYTGVLKKKGSWISAAAQFERIPVFPHGIYGIYISGGVRIGRDCVIFQQVTIGSNTLLDSKGLGAPQIGDCCYIGAGAKIIGNVRVGHNVRIGANAVVCRDIPDNSVVTAQSVVTTRENAPDNCFYHRHNGVWRFFKDGVWREVGDSADIATLKSRFDRVEV